MTSQLRIEFYLPEFYNNNDNLEQFGEPIENKKFLEIKNMVINKFGCLSVHPGTIQGTWTDENSKIRFFDNCKRYEISVNNRDDNLEFFRKLKEAILDLFEQKAVYMISTPIDRI